MWPRFMHSFNIGCSASTRVVFFCLFSTSHHGFIKIVTIILKYFKRIPGFTKLLFAVMQQHGASICFPLTSRIAELDEIQQMKAWLSYWMWNKSYFEEDDIKHSNLKPPLIHIIRALSILKNVVRVNSRKPGSTMNHWDFIISSPNVCQRILG